MNSKLGTRLRSPVFATAALLLTGVAFAGIIFASYPESQKAAEENLPVVTADSSPLREEPTEPGGMDVAHEDSTIYNSIRSSELQETPPIENLLAQEQPADTGEDVAAAEPAPGDLQHAPLAALEPAASDNAEDTPPPSEMADATMIAKPAVPDIKVSEGRSIPMKTPSAVPSETPSVQPSAAAPAPGSSPETLAYVRSVLNNTETDAAKIANESVQVAESKKKSKPEPSADSLSKIEPTAGGEDVGSLIKAGNTYVQLASISSESLAPKEWVKLQKQFPSLKGAEYRVQKADLGAKGIFYRIQAGPMSKDSAKSVCDAVKAQKPGGCIIVQ